MPKEKIEIKGEQSAVEKYLFYYREILNGMELDSIAPEASHALLAKREKATRTGSISKQNRPPTT